MVPNTANDPTDLTSRKGKPLPSFFSSQVLPPLPLNICFRSKSSIPRLLKFERGQFFYAWHLWEYYPWSCRKSEPPTDPTNTTIVLKGIPLSARLQSTGTSVNYIDPALREDRRLNSSKRGLPERVGIAKQEPHPPAKWALCVNVNDRN